MLFNPKFKRLVGSFLIAAVCVWLGVQSESFGQTVSSKNAPSLNSPSEAPALNKATLEDLAAAAKAPKKANVNPSPGIDFLSLLLKGGIFMIPIGFVSLIVVMFCFERWIGLRTSKLLPSQFARRMIQMSRESESIDPRVAYAYCIENPSATSNVVRAMLLRAGRPQQEVKDAADEVSQREADKAYAGVRWLHFSAGVAPLLGLLGTVWGLIRAFHDLTLLGPTQSRADFLGRGIYEALVTTLAGLVVAIPAALAAHFFEGRITRVFRSIEELVFTLIPKLERYEGRVRFDPIGRDLVARNIEGMKKSTTAAPEAAKATAVPPVQAATSTTNQNTPHVAGSPSIRKTIQRP